MDSFLEGIEIVEAPKFRPLTIVWTTSVVSLGVPIYAQFAQKTYFLLLGYATVVFITIPASLGFRLRGENNELAFSDEPKMVANRKRRRRLPLVLVPALILGLVSLVRFALAVS